MKIKALNSMPVDELWTLHKQIISVLSSKMLEEKARLESRLSQLESAVSSSVKTRRPYPTVLPKFRNPMRPSETWAGRGKLPRWLSAQMQSGKQMDDFRIRAS